MGPLKGIKVVEFAGIGPGPFCGMILSDMGAEVIRIDRKAFTRPDNVDIDLRSEAKYNILGRGKRSIALDLKHPEGVTTALRLIEQSDVLIEGYRPGVMERLGLGPEVCHKKNRAIIYARMTGWGQNGPLAHAAGHDINYIALTGALGAIGKKEGPPVVPLNLVGDFGGGAMFLAFGIVCGLLEAKSSGRGQVVDAAMTDGTALLMSMMYGLKAVGDWSEERESNLLDGAAHFYATYECADGKYISIGSIETAFYELLLEKTGLHEAEMEPQNDKAKWPELKKRLKRVFLTKTRDQWCEIMEGTDVCFAPVLGMEEAPSHAHNRARKTFVEIDGITQPAPAPRFDRTQPEVQGSSPVPGEHTEQILSGWGFKDLEIMLLAECGAI